MGKFIAINSYGNKSSPNIIVGFEDGEDTYTGIDVGANGGIVTINSSGKILVKTLIPTKQIQKPGRKGKSSVIDWYKLGEELSLLKGYIAIEDVHSVFGSGASGNFSFGEVKGFKRGVLRDKDVTRLSPYTNNRWQSNVWIQEDMVYDTSGKKKKRDTKATSLNAANRIFGVDDSYWVTKRSKIQDGLVDAALMAYVLMKEKTMETIEEFMDKN